VTVANRQQLPPRYRQWARMTVVGRVIGMTNQEPILLLMYARGWTTQVVTKTPGKHRSTLPTCRRSPKGFTENFKHSKPSSLECLLSAA
jgi:hypothetical protein